MQTTVVSLFRFRSFSRRLWVLGQMGAARLPLMRLPGLTFWKLCGSGTGEGFTPRPNTEVWAILTVWDSAGQAEAAIAQAEPFTTWQIRASEHWSVVLEPFSARGSWAGVAPFNPEGESGDGPIAVLTRATVRTGMARRFWGRVPDISARIGANEDVLFKIGIGEVPLLHQITFSIWPDLDRMTDFACKGPHAGAVAAVRAEGWFREELYARFRVAGTIGRWAGGCPLTGSAQTQEMTA